MWYRTWSESLWDADFGRHIVTILSEMSRLSADADVKTPQDNSHVEWDGFSPRE